MAYGATQFRIVERSSQADRHAERDQYGMGPRSDPVRDRHAERDQNGIV